MEEEGEVRDKEKNSTVSVLMAEGLVLGRGHLLKLRKASLNLEWMHRCLKVFMCFMPLTSCEFFKFLPTTCGQPATCHS